MYKRVISYWNLHRIPILIAILSILLYWSFAYQLQRPDYIKLLTLYAALFFCCFKLIQFEKWNYRFLLAAGLMFRLVFLLAVPNLSQDYFRFLWDGGLLSQGINPYLFSPDQLMADPAFQMPNATELHQGMGELSARHYSNYPPFNQFFFYLGKILGGNSIIGGVIALRMLIIAGEIGVFFLGRKLLRRINRSPHLIAWYFLNPLVIIELTGNLHFEGLMLCFFMAALNLLSLGKHIGSAVFYALSVALKLIPLLVLPVFIRYPDWKKGVIYTSLVVLGTLLCFIPVYSPEFTSNYTATLGLWFSNFEFNAGIYNLVKGMAIEFGAKPWKLIKAYGNIIPYLIIGVILAFALLRKNNTLPRLMESVFWVVTIYYLLSPTVHPWYIIFPLLLCLFTDFRFPILWSAVVMLSYTAYATSENEEILWLLFIEYSLVIGFAIYEIISLKGLNLQMRKN